jgi:hypothetical protein
MSLIPTWKLWFSGSITFKIELNSHRKRMCLMLLLLTQMILFLEIHALLQLSWSSLFGANRAFVHLGNYALQEVIFSKTDSILTGKEYGRYYCLLKRWFSLKRYMCFFNVANRPVWNKIILPPPWKLWLAGSTAFKTNSILKGKQCPLCSCF